MTQIDVMARGGVPLVRLGGPVTHRSGAELASEVMLMINLATEDPDEFPHPLSEARPRI
ncbi:hypothetical protein [Mycolicibacterium conceptionense]|uniref:hypothetical protein n=1 Tax=Mycolicibacterium conceptionense TaxID=451644 RepID=UPI000A6D75B0|nr:hypothetical protein [Mycolicibacterium conceptionense]